MTDIASRPVPADQTQVRLRCSDADRERFSARLRDAAGEGRLTMAELDERLTAVYAATYYDDFASVTADLPRPDRAPTGWPAFLTMILSWWAGESAKRRRLMLAGTAVIVLVALVGAVAGALHGFGVDGFEHHGPEFVGR